jgi:RNA-directed DNA polymerase
MILETMSAQLGIPVASILTIARRASHLYRQYSIPKRNGGSRFIEHPAKPLKALQKWLTTTFIETLPVHPCATAYVKQASTTKNARAHAAGNYLLRMDLESFFPSITTADMLTYKESNGRHFHDWTDDDFRYFLLLTFLRGHLAIGAPSSPLLSNVLCFELDKKLNEIAHDRGVVYTRYSDDLFFSATAPGILRGMESRVAEAISSLEYPRNLRINTGKTRHSSRRGRRRVTGITLTSTGQISLGRSLKRQLCSKLFKRAGLTPPERAQLEGMLAYCKAVEPDFINRLIIKFGLPAVKEVCRFL